MSTGINWTEVLTAYALPVFTFLGVVVQSVTSNRQSKNTDARLTALEEKADKNDKRLERVENSVNTNTQYSKDNKKLMEDLRDNQNCNDVATVAVVRESIRRMYYELLPYKIISIVDFRSLTEMYRAYKGVTLPDGHHPNSWCDALYNEMNSWDKVEVYPSHLSHLEAGKEKGKNK